MGVAIGDADDLSSEVLRHEGGGGKTLPIEEEGGESGEAIP